MAPEAWTTEKALEESQKPVKAFPIPRFSALGRAVISSDGTESPRDS